MRRKSLLGYFLAVNALSCTFILAQTFRPPAVPLVAHDPYFSIWSTLVFWFQTKI